MNQFEIVSNEFNYRSHVRLRINDLLNSELNAMPNAINYDCNSVANPIQQYFAG